MANSRQTSCCSIGRLANLSAFTCSDGVGLPTESVDSADLFIRNLRYLRFCSTKLVSAHGLRGLQGFFECTISPGFLMVIGTWYRREEHSNRAFWWQSANAGFGIIASLVNYGIGSHAEKYGGLAPWRCISLFLGACTIVLALICFFLLGSPKEVMWLNKDEKRMA